MNNKYPGGHVEFSFEMPVDHRQPIIFQINDPRVKELMFKKLSPIDQFDYKWQLVILLREVSSIEEVDNIGAEIKDSILDFLSFTLRTGVYNIQHTGHGLMPREGEGAQGHMILPALTCNGTIKSGGRKLSQTELDDMGDLLSKSALSNNPPLVSIFSYAMRIEEPIVKFMLLYLILYEVYKDQKSIDQFIMRASPSTLQMPSPHNGNPETVFTKLRNEVTHRISNPPERTRSEIITNMLELENIAHMAVMSQLK